MADTTMPLTDEQHTACGKALFNLTWTFLSKPDRTGHDDEMMAHAAHASYLHWSKVGEPVNFSRAEWLLSRVYAVLGRPETALRHGRRCLDICETNGIGDFDLAFAHEALARAHSVAGHAGEAGRHLELAEKAGRNIADEEDRKMLLDDLRTIPGSEPAGT